jgi:hypothetical protein
MKEAAKMTLRPPPTLAIVALLAALMLSGCVGFSLVKGGERVSLKGSMSVQVPRDWNSFQSPNATYWTLDGASLQHIVFAIGVADGEIPWFTGADSEKAPKYRKNMTVIEVSELAQATMALEKLQRVQVGDLKPARFAGKEGFTFSFTCTTKKGLDLNGLAFGAIVKERLYMAIYRGAKLHYFDRGLPDFKAIVSSTRIEGLES